MGSLDKWTAELNHMLMLKQLHSIHIDSKNAMHAGEADDSSPWMEFGGMISEMFALFSKTGGI
jgi:hypothetical protein